MLTLAHPRAAVAAALAAAALAAGAAAGTAQAATVTFAGGVLTVTGDNSAETFTVSRDAGGAIHVSGLPDRGATVANTFQVAVDAKGGNDRVVFDQANGALPRAVLAGGDGNDELAGGAGNDTIDGGAGNDVIDGNTGNDPALRGGPGDDAFSWNPGEGDDVVDGNGGADTLQFNGSSASETITADPFVAQNPNRLLLSRNIGGAMSVATVEQLGLRTFDGVDRVTLAPNLKQTGLLRTKIQTGGTLTPNVQDDVIQGGDTIDKIDALAGNDTVSGGSANDTITGGLGNDVMLGNDGDDTMVWDDADGNDRVEGEAGSDLLDVNGGNVAERFDVSAAGSRLRVVRDVASVDLDAGTVERLAIETFAGRDVVTAPAAVPGLAALDLKLEAADDGQVDTVLLTGTDAAESLKVAPLAPLQVRVSSGAGRTVHDVTRASELQLNAGGGDDQLTSALSRSAFFTVLTMRGQDGNDTLTGGAADEALVGGSGNDTLRGNAGIDALFGEDGNDSLFGGADSDVLSGGLGIDRLDGGLSADQISCGGPGDSVIPGAGDTINPDCG